MIMYFRSYGLPDTYESTIPEIHICPNGYAEDQNGQCVPIGDVNGPVYDPTQLNPVEGPEYRPDLMPSNTPWWALLGVAAIAVLTLR